MVERIEKYGLRVARSLYNLIDQEALPGTGIAPERFWRGFSGLIHNMAPRNRELLARRESLQKSIDDWHRARVGQAHDPSPGVEPDGGNAVSLRDVERRIVIGTAKHGPVLTPGTREELLRQRRPVIRRVLFVADAHDVAGEFFVAQGLARTHTGE